MDPGSGGSMAEGMRVVMGHYRGVGVCRGKGLMSHCNGGSIDDEKGCGNICG